MSKLLKAIHEPQKAFGVVIALLKSSYYKTRYAFSPRVKIGKNFRVDGRLRIKGPGNIVIGDNVKIGMCVDLYTHSPNAIITIGDGTFLNGTRMSSEYRICIERNCILADCRIMDTDFHGVDPKHRDQYKVAPILIQENVWVTIGVVILKGVTIGYGSTITPLSVVSTRVPSNCVFGGNPAKFIVEQAG